MDVFLQTADWLLLCCICSLYKTWIVQSLVGGTHRCCHSRRRRWAPLASCRDSAPWSPNRSCRWGWAPPPAGRGTEQTGRGGDAGEKKGEGGKKRVETVSQLNSFIVQMKTNKVALCVPPQRMTAAVCIKTLTVNWMNATTTPLEHMWISEQRVLRWWRTREPLWLAALYNLCGVSR